MTNPFNINSTRCQVRRHDIFKIQVFDLVHDSFFTNLSNKYPSLTQSDLRYCAYLRLNMTTKEIAKATGVTVKGVEAAKGRLRKKMSIPQDSSIGTFLLNITVP